MWENYYSDIDGLLYVIDSTADLSSQISTLNTILDNKYMKKAEIPLLVVINKVDKEGFDKFKDLNNLLDFGKLNKKNYNFLTTSAITGQGIKEAMNWIFYSMCNNNIQDEEEIDPNLAIV